MCFPILLARSQPEMNFPPQKVFFLIHSTFIKPLWSNKSKCLMYHSFLLAHWHFTHLKILQLITHHPWSLAYSWWAAAAAATAAVVAAATDLHFACPGNGRGCNRIRKCDPTGGGRDRFYGDSSEELWINSGNLMTCADYGNGNNFSAVFR